MKKTRQKSLKLLQKYQKKYDQQTLKTVPFQLGIDQAGRGPVFGSMIYSALWWPIQLKQQLSQIGFADSKALTQQQRQQLLETIDLLRGKILFYQTKQLTAEYISTCMNNQVNNINLNQMSHQAAISLAYSALKQGFQVTHIYADTVGDPGKYANLLRKGLDQFSDIIKQVIVQPKADRDHKVVSASSICAKVTRDKILKNWKFRQNIQFKGQLGSGYPGDPKTKQWLQNNKNEFFGFPNIVRFSWSTSVNSLNNKLKLKIIQKDQQKLMTGFNLFTKPKELNKDLFAMIKE